MGNWAAQTIESDLGLPAHIKWFDQGVPCWSALLPCNGLGRVKSLEFVSAMKRDLLVLRRQFPSLTVVFSALTDRRLWRDAKPGRINKAKKLVNSVIGDFVKDPGCMVLSDKRDHANTFNAMSMCRSDFNDQSGAERLLRPARAFQGRRASNKRDQHVKSKVTVLTTTMSTPSLPPSGSPGCAPDSASPSSSGFSPPVITVGQVRSELRRLHPRKAAGPDGVCPRLLKACADELGEPLQHVFNLSLQLRRVPSLWKTSCIVPVPKKTRPCERNDYRPVTLTSHAMKTLERLVMRLMRPQAQNVRDPLQFAYQEKVGVEDAVLYLLHCALSYLDGGRCIVRLPFFDFSSAFNTIQPSLLQEKLNIMAVDPHLVNWIMDYLTNRPQYV
ncbi:hypothetical protein WMY93_014098 [Mugilogobius chulae]|uniref:Reverse transcriptase domain-containing protein n=1 Tax=Mugilogobius chulae TaxID=88201 RepID=A0AAW0NUD7_9GOBI